MRDKFIFCDNQDIATPTSTGEISDDIWDLEEDVSVDQQVEGWLNVVINSVPSLADGDEGLRIDLITDDAAACTTARTAAGAGFINIGGIDIRFIDLVAGASFAIPFRYDVCKKYLAVWIKALSTTFAGTINLDAYFSATPVAPSSSKQGFQKKPT